MLNLIRSNIIVIAAIIIGAYYGFTEFKKHQFNLANMTNVDIVSIAVVIFTYIIIVSIAYITKKRNEQLYKFLHKEIEELNRPDANNNLFTEMKGQYHELVIDDYSTINVPSFLESFMATYVYKGNRTIPKELKLLQANLSTPILVGVLGTFVGLVMALSQLEIGDTSHALNLQPILNGVGTAFYTSIIGVLFSILIGVNLRHSNSDQLFIQHMLKVENLLYKESRNRSDQKVVDTLITVRQEIINMRHSFEDVSSFSKEFKNASKNLQAFNKDFSSNLSDMKLIFESTKDVMGLFNTRTAQFHEDFERLFEYFKNNDEHHDVLMARQTEFNSELRNTFESNKRFQNDSLGHLHNIQGTFNDSVEKLEAQFTGVSSTMDAVSNAINNQFGTLLESQKAIIEAQSKYDELNKQQIGVVVNATSTMKSILENSNFDSLTEASQLFSNSTESIQKVVQQFVDTYKEIQVQSNEHYKTLEVVAKKMETMFDVQSSISENQAKELQNTIQLITKYQEDLQQAVIRFLNNDFDYDKLRKILDEVRENMETQNQFLLQRLSLIQERPVQPNPEVQNPNYAMNR
jgi:hypothetical protein